MPNVVGNRRLSFSGIYFDPDAASFITAANITSSTEQQAVNTLVLQLKLNSLWSLFYAIYPFVGGTSSSNSYNLKNIAQYQITWVGGVTFGSAGVDFNGTTGYGRTGLIPSSVMTINSTSTHYYSTEDLNNTGCDVGSVASATSQIRMFCRNSGNFNGFMYNSTAGQGLVQSAVADSLGLFSVSRTASNNMILVKNGNLLATNTGSGGTLPNVEFYIGAANSNGTPANFGSRNCAFAAIGSGLDSTQCATLNTLVENFNA